MRSSFAFPLEQCRSSAVMIFSSDALCRISTQHAWRSAARRMRGRAVACGGGHVCAAACPVAVAGRAVARRRCRAPRSDVRVAMSPRRRSRLRRGRRSRGGVTDGGAAVAVAGVEPRRRRGAGGSVRPSPSAGSAEPAAAVRRPGGDYRSTSAGAGSTMAGDAPRRRAAGRVLRSGSTSRRVRRSLLRRGGDQRAAGDARVGAVGRSSPAQSRGSGGRLRTAAHGGGSGVP